MKNTKLYWELQKRESGYLKQVDHVYKYAEDTLSGQGDTRSEKSQFLPLLRCFPSAYAQYAEGKRLAGTKIDFFPTL